MDSPFVVSRVPFKYTRLIDSNGNFHKSVNAYDAKASAEKIGLQLVCFNMPENNELALCKIIDFGKWKYNMEKSTRKAHHQHIQTHELYFTPNIENHDIEHKIKKAEEFIKDGHEVMFILKVSGRDLAHMDLAQEKMNLIVEKALAFSSVDSRKTMGKMIYVKITKKKKEKVNEV